MDHFNCNIFDNRRIKPNDLEVGRSYPLERLERVNSEYGQGIVAKLKLRDESVVIFLPGYFTSKLSDAAVDEINAQTNLSLVYKGPTANSHKYTLTKRESE